MQLYSNSFAAELLLDTQREIEAWRMFGLVVSWFGDELIVELP
jgi:hypothetical protein